MLACFLINILLRSQRSSNYAKWQNVLFYKCYYHYAAFRIRLPNVGCENVEIT
jgi:hypothetical protein